MTLQNAFGDLALDASVAATTEKLEQVRALFDTVIDQAAGFEKMRVGTVQNRIAANFSGASMPQDGFSVASLGSGQAVTLGGVANGSRYLSVATGTTASAETIIQHSDLVTLPTRFTVQVTTSQRIANQECYFELAGVDENGEVVSDATGPLNWIAVRWDGTSVNNAVVLTRSGGSVSTSASLGFGSTAPSGTSPNFLPATTIDLLAYAERIVVSGYPVDASGSPNSTTARSTNLPNPNIRYRARFRVRNLGTAPASTTDFRLHQVRILDQTRLTAEITGGVGRSDGQGGVAVTGAVSATGQTSTSRIGFMAAHGVWYDESATALAASATFNGTSRDLIPGGVAGTAFNQTTCFAQEFRAEAISDVTGTLYLEVSTNGTTWRRIKSVALAQGSGASMAFFGEIIHPPKTRYARVVFVNGAAAQTYFTCSTLAASA